VGQTFVVVKVCVYICLQIMPIKSRRPINRIIQNEAEPVWDETTMVLVFPPDINAEERLKVEIWDSGTSSAHVVKSSG
jgi:Ca2+-dependent lipid-binding protein